MSITIKHRDIIRGCFDNLILKPYIIFENDYGSRGQIEEGQIQKILSFGLEKAVEFKNKENLGDLGFIIISETPQNKASLKFNIWSSKNPVSLFSQSFGDICRIAGPIKDFARELNWDSTPEEIDIERYESNAWNNYLYSNKKHQDKMTYLGDIFVI